MPRRPCDSTTEHRITFGSLERDFIRQVIETPAQGDDDQDQIIPMTSEDFRNIAQGVQALSVPLVLAGAGVIGLAVFGKVREVIDGVNPLNGVMLPGSDRTIAETVFGSKVPKPVTFGDRIVLEDPRTGEPVVPPENPLAGTPVGGLFGLGMRIGNTFNPFVRWRRA